MNALYQRPRVSIVFSAGDLISLEVTGRDYVYTQEDAKQFLAELHRQTMEACKKLEALEQRDMKESVLSRINSATKEKTDEIS